jgi:hypothetical protein
MYSKAQTTCIHYQTSWKKEQEKKKIEKEPRSNNSYNTYKTHYFLCYSMRTVYIKHSSFHERGFFASPKPGATTANTLP